jgi:hypothetical protein
LPSIPEGEYVMSRAQQYRTIKSLVIDFVHRSGGKVDYDALTAEVKRHFPASRWQKTHWAWYRCQIVRGRFKALFSEAERTALSQGKPSPVVIVPPALVPEKGDRVAPPARGPLARDQEIKLAGDALLNHVRTMVSLIVGDDVDKRFKLNRWIFSRLLQDEIRTKRPIKKLLWDRGMRKCQACGEVFASLKNVQIHRKNESEAYSAENCELLCRECHEEIG